MNILVSDKWLREYVRMEQNPEEFAATVSKIGPSVERINRSGADLDKVVVGKILSLAKHPNADKLRLAIVDVGGKKLNIVCGGVNLYENELVAVALVGASVRWHGEGDLVALEPATIRGVASEGMICGANEIGLADRYPHAEKEIMDLTAKPGGELLKPGMLLADALGLRDCVYDIEVTSNRPDAFGIVGLAREAAAATGGKFLWKESQLPRFKISAQGGSSSGRQDSRFKVAIQAKKLCSRYAGVRIDGITAKESPDWLKERLISAGLRPINSVVDITNYVMLELGQPMHAFDASKVKQESIIVRTAKEGEKIKALDGNIYKLSPEMLVIADATTPVAVAGIIGGAESGVTSDTKDIILEAASFNSASVRRTGRDLNIRTDAVMRFEKNVPSGLIGPAAARAAELVVALCGGKITAIRDVSVKKQIAKRISISLGALGARIGVNLAPAAVKKYLEALGFAVTASAKNISVRVPYWREGDICIPEDLTEEVARLYGYERLPSLLPPNAVSGETPNPIFDVEAKVRGALVNAGATEIISVSLVGDELIKKSSESDVPVVRIANPLTKDMALLRPSHRARILECAARNEKISGGGEVFEIGNVFTPDPDRDRLPAEILSLGIAVWSKDAAGASFYRAKGFLVRAALVAGSPLTFGKDFPKDGFWHPGRTASVHIGSAVVGVLGELSPEAIVAAGIESRVALALVDFKEIARSGGRNSEFRGIPPFPPVFRDVALIVPRETEHEFIVAAFRAVDPLIVSADLFDRYEGKNVPEGKKSLAYHLAYQSPARTLTSEEVEVVHAKALKMLEHKFGAVIRA
jgi:phenylalanyl-tRNA synthetase beta chain